MRPEFQKKKAAILKKFKTEGLDPSPKGCPDEPIISLLDLINHHPHLVTTSSCSGRIAIYVESDVANSIGGKGLGGRWLMVRHEPWEDGLEDLDILSKICGEYPVRRVDFKESKRGRLIHFKFEPMILHIMSETISTARAFLSSALSSKFRESGLILSKKNNIIAVRSSIGFSCPIGYLKKEENVEFVELLVDEKYLYLLIDMANKRFKENERRRDMLYKNISGWIMKESEIDMENKEEILKK
ncbi:hypothetical protein T552_01839 [Pneumocystis carinii B80]|uniref:tRNA wybutosine-synthesizing protein 3 n=1 Tax=Pneumocystis carinii (strain B80) TaxID=1408658 RepID=A0A0W4ZJN5_PNEC8|nr:hypothetical protein T552_01839 [Pneumocystis carinii B80]KTW28578.1 hypothetical protein T552_01839 [Pneumocystis carinii B80]